MGGEDLLHTLPPGIVDKIARLLLDPFSYEPPGGFPWGSGPWQQRGYLENVDLVFFDMIPSWITDEHTISKCRRQESHDYSNFLFAVAISKKWNGDPGFFQEHFMFHVDLLRENQGRPFPCYCSHQDPLQDPQYTESIMDVDAYYKRKRNYVDVDPYYKRNFFSDREVLNGVRYEFKFLLLPYVHRLKTESSYFVDMFAPMGHGTFLFRITKVLPCSGSSGRFSRLNVLTKHCKS